MDKNGQRLALLALLEALDQRGSWSGETHLQKCAFFLQEGLHAPLGVEFVLYKHGPFSFDLRQALGEMQADMLIDVIPRPHPYGPSLAVSESGRAYLEKHREAAQRHMSQITFVADQLGKRSVAELERLGTALLIRQAETDLDLDRRAARLTELKPHITTQLARQAVDEVEQLLKDSSARQQETQPVVPV